MMKLLYEAEGKKDQTEIEPEPFTWEDLKVEPLPAVKEEKASGKKKNSARAQKEEREREKERKREEERIKAQDALLQEQLRRAEAYLEKCKQESKVQCEKARQEAFEEGKSQGYEDGFKEGFEEGRNEGYKVYGDKLGELESRFNEFLQTAEIAKQKMLDDHMKDLKEIALTIGEKIVRTSLRTNSDVIERMILAATEKLKKSTWAKIYVDNRQEAVKAIQADPKFLQELDYLSDHIKIVTLEGMEPGTCIIERPDEIIDISVSTQLENIRDIMDNA